MKKRMRAVLAERAERTGKEASSPAGALSTKASRPPPHGGLVGSAASPLAGELVVGTLRLPNRLVQAPLAGIANWAFRRQSRRHGAGLAVSEMVASFGVRHENRKTLAMLTTVADEHPVGIQLFGPDPAAMAEAARAAEAAGADLVDVNMGCPVRKVCKTGAGAALLDDPEAAARVVAAMARAVALPVTVKMRRGVTPATSRPAETARRLAAAGAAAICFHPRAAEEEYAGTADHRHTAVVVEAVDVPVIASGDIDSPDAARRVMEETGCAGIAVGRAALGNPWVFGELLAGVPRPRPGLAEVVAELSGFAADARTALGEDRARAYLRKFYPWYLADQPVDRADVLALQTAPTLAGALGLLHRLPAARLAA